MDKTVIQTTDISKPPFSPRPIPPTSETLAAPQAGGAHQNGTIDPTSTGDAQPVLGASTNLPLSAIDSLPIIAGQSRRIIRPEDEIPDFLDFELDLSRLNRIHDQLWMAGRPMRARPLHRYKMMGMEVLQTQQMDLHLLKFSTKLLVKPLPEWMVCHNFWTEWLCKDGDEDDKSKDDRLWKSAAGFLVSYVWLVTTPLDLKIAHDCFLLPSFITWHWWKDFARDFMDHVDMETLQQIRI
ncbi:hypothetical protein DDE82_008956 [Stemphylium lycopersici]|uniref:Uncharacterized protein n=1 Tax=Stemphylium lycopersici TaxID=183478 RepID=A0A364NBF7_STELY|nr:hypothetical protein TW65_97121 [Stemphylium lycopersici]RAQ98745.1 hypothetical protein DDE82_008956 [Stemphylium lycopersici]RAR14649.1 hypothetical protein DDE83_001872 [Stemphylium lycopersici]